MIDRLHQRFKSDRIDLQWTIEQNRPGVSFNPCFGHSAKNSP